MLETALRARDEDRERQQVERAEQMLERRAAHRDTAVAKMQTAHVKGSPPFATFPTNSL